MATTTTPLPPLHHLTSASTCGAAPPLVAELEASQTSLLEPLAFFVSWQGVLTLAYRWVCGAGALHASSAPGLAVSPTLLRVVPAVVAHVCAPGTGGPAHPRRQTSVRIGSPKPLPLRFLSSHPRPFAGEYHLLSYSVRLGVPPPAEASRPPCWTSKRGWRQRCPTCRQRTQGPSGPRLAWDACWTTGGSRQTSCRR